MVLSPSLRSPARNVGLLVAPKRVIAPPFVVLAPVGAPWVTSEDVCFLSDERVDN